MTTDAAAAAQRWASNLAGATSKIQAGVEAVRVAPGQAAARQAQVWVANTQASLQKFQRNVAAVSLSDWQTATVSKGLPRIATGAQAAEGKFQTFMTRFLPFLAQQVNALPARGTLDQNINRMVALVRATSQFKNA